jgi:hypothetical protein
VGLLCGGVLIGAGALDKPEADIAAIWLGAGFLVYYGADLYLLYRSYKRKHKPTHWVALILALLPVLLILALVFFASFFESYWDDDSLMLRSGAPFIAFSQSVCSALWTQIS